MVWDYLHELEVQCWLHLGKLGRTSPTVCMYHPQPKFGAAPLLQALEDLEAESNPAHRTLTFQPNDRKNACTSLRLQLELASEQLQLFQLSYAGARATLIWTPAGLPLIRQALLTWQQGGEDFGLAPRHANLRRHQFGSGDLASLELWFWGPTYSAP